MAFIGLAVPADIARLLGQIEIPGDKVPVGESHVTILNLGKDVPVEQLAKCISAVFAVTSVTKPFTVQTSRVTAFSPNPDDGVPIIALIDSPALHALWASLKKSLDDAGVKYNDKWPTYRPHTTLGYAQDPLVHADNAADQSIPLVEWGVGEIVLWGGDAGANKLVATFPFSMEVGRVATDRAFVRLAVIGVSDRLRQIKELGVAAHADGNQWLVDFSKSVAGRVVRGHTLSERQQETLDRSLRQYKISCEGGCECGCGASCPCAKQKVVGRYLQGL